MMPVVRLNDATFADLKSISTWIGTDTPSQTIDKLVVEMMKELDLERDFEDVAETSGPESKATEFERAPGLTFTRVISATIDGKEVHKPNWATLLLEAIAAIKSKGIGGDDLAKELEVPASKSRLNTQGYTYHQNLGISVQGQSAQDAWKEVNRIADKWKVPVKVHFQWRHNPKAQHPGKEGVLRAGGA
jgi:hypothetical protein